jgi:hypothetical protein
MDRFIQFIMSSSDLYGEINNFDYLYFLIYKKYFIERIKIQKTLNGL